MGLRPFLAAAIVAVLAGCAAQGPLPATGASASAPAPYRLAPGDKVRVTTFGEPTLSGDFQVAPGGAIALPLVGSIPAAGLQPAELQRAITTALAAGYLNDPKVTVDVLSYRPIYVLGEVGKPGEYPYVVGLNALTAVATAAGFTYRANQRWVFIKRAGAAAEEKVPFGADVLIGPGDTIRVGERYF